MPDEDQARPGPPGQEDASPRDPQLPDSLAWALRYLPEYFSDAPSDFHRELMRDLQNPDNRLLARIAPRGHAKSTCAALAYPLWCLCEQRRRNIVIITQESSLATQFVRDIRAELESNEAILAAYGDLCRPPPPPDAARGRAQSTSLSDAEEPARPPRRGKWGEAKLITSAGLAVQAKSCGASLRGTRVGPLRPDLIICDDIEKDALVRSFSNRRKLENWLRRVVMPALAPHGQLVIVGSLIHHDCLLANLHNEQRFARWNYRVYRAFQEQSDQDGVLRRVALWPARWSLEKLSEERARVGTPAFEQEYMANPIDDAERTFRPEWLRSYDPAELESCAARLVNLMAVDPAVGKDTGDFCAIWVGSVDTVSGVIYTRVLSLQRVHIVDQVDHILALYRQWRPLRLGVETTAYQETLTHLLEDTSRKAALYIPLVALRTVVGKIARVQASSVLYENGLFRLPPVLDPEAELQFLHFPGGAHDDAPDVCAMGIELAREFLGQQRIEAVSSRRSPASARRNW